MTAPDLRTQAGVQALIETTPIHGWLGFRLVDMDAAAGVLRIAAPNHGHAARFAGAEQAHGGVLAALIDSTATFACAVMLGRPVPTMNLRVDYLRPAVGDELMAAATVRRAGRTMAVVDVDVTSGGALVAVGRCVLATASGGAA